MKNLNKVFAILAVFFAVVLTSSCVASMSPADRYAREHKGKAFQGWDEEGKKMDKQQKKKVKDPRGTIGFGVYLDHAVDVEAPFNPFAAE